MELLCTNCGYDIDERTANINTNLVECPNCHRIHRVDILLQAQEQIDNLPTKNFLEERPSNAIFDNRKYEVKRFENNYSFIPVPSNSKIDFFDTSTSLEITVPTAGFQKIDLFYFVFVTFWVVFVAFWTFFASTASIFFAMFSIPFWFVGFAMATSLVGKFTETQLVELDKYSLKITKKRLFTQKTYEFDIEDIKKIVHEKPQFKSYFGSEKWNTAAAIGNEAMPVIKGRNMNVAVFEFLSKAEQDWGMKVLKDGIAKFSEQKV